MRDEVNTIGKAGIMVVEDERIVAMDTEELLCGLGYQVCIVVPSGEEAILAATGQCPDLVLMDIRLGGQIDGIKAAEVIRNKLDIPVIFLSAYSDHKTVDRAKRIGPFGYLLKPFKEEEVRIAIECALWRHEMEKEATEKRPALKCSCAIHKKWKPSVS